MAEFDFKIRKVASSKQEQEQEFEIRKVTSESKEAERPAKKPSERPSDPGKHYLAGLTNLATDIPIILGMGGSGIQAGYNTLIGDEPISTKAFMENFQTAMLDEGLDAKLMELGLAGRKGVHEAYGIEEPKSTEDLAAELGALVTPIPGARFAAGVKGLGIGARALRAAAIAANLLTPMVKYGPKGNRLSKGFAIRAGTQAGVGLTVDQAVRTLIDSPLAPTLFSEQALTGGVEKPSQLPTHVPEPGEVHELMSATGVPETVLAGFNIRKVTKVETDDELFADTPDGFEKRRDLDAKVEARQDSRNTNFWLTMAAVATGSIVGLRMAQKRGKLLPKKQLTQEEQARTGVEAAAKVHADYVDKSAHIGDTLIAQGNTKEEAAKVVRNAHSDPVGMADEFMRSADLGQDFTPNHNRPMFAPDDLQNRAIALGRENEELFNDAMVAATVLAGRRNVKALDPELFPHARSTDEYLEILERAKKVEGMEQLMKDTFSTFDGLLDYRLHRKVISTDEVTKWRGKFVNADGGTNYMALYTKSEEEMWRRMARYFLGVHTTVGKKAEINAEFLARGGEAGEDALGAIQSLKRYAANTIIDSNEQSFRGNILTNLAGIATHGKGKAITRFIVVNGKKIKVAGADLQKYAGRETLLIGRASDLEKDIAEKTSIKIDFESDPRVVGGRYLPAKFEGKTLADLQAKYGDEIQTALIDGEMFVFHVPDIGLQAALDLSPRLSAKLRFWSHWKGVMTKGTTGHFSPFAPFSHMFSSQQVALNTAAREGLWEGIKTPFRSIKGTYQLMVANGANDLAELVARNIATRTSIGSFAPEAALRLHRVLKNKYERTMISRFRAETGKTITGMGQHSTNTTVDDIIRTYGNDFVNFFGAREIGTVWKLWKTWNNAWHEGPAYAAMLRYMDNNFDAGVPLTGQQVRDAVDYGKILAGDMTRKGSTKVAAAVNASMPFGTATIQSWNSLFSAARKHPGRFLMGASALIGVPTMSEMIWNAMITEGSDKLWDDPHTPGKQWTHNDYYWNGFTTGQRTSNFIYMIPGRPPWEAVIIPVSPEWSLFRGAVMDGFDSILNFSNVGDLATANQGLGKVGREHLWGSFARVADIPLPPILAGLATWSGADVRLGLSVEYDTDPDDPGKKAQLLRRVPIGKGERISPRLGQSRHVNGLLDIDATSIMQDIFGAAGGVVAMGIEGWHAEMTDKDASFIDGITGLTDAAMSGLYTQTRILNPIFGKALSPNVNSDEISKSLFARKKGLESLAKHQDIYRGAGLIHLDGSPVSGNTLSKMMRDDPINFELSADAKKLQAKLRELDVDVNKLNRNISTTMHSTDLGTASEKRDQMDSMKLQVLGLKAEQLRTLLDYEETASIELSKRYRRDVRIDLSTFKPRPNLKSSSILQELQ